MHELHPFVRQCVQSTAIRAETLNGAKGHAAVVG